jgi:hypothetical protein
MFEFGDGGNSLRSRQVTGWIVCLRLRPRKGDWSGLWPGVTVRPWRKIRKSVSELEGRAIQGNRYSVREFQRNDTPKP